MTTISVINLKGGVGKTISAINISHTLAATHEKRVLLVDNDKQGNTTKFFGLHNEELPSISEVLTEKDVDTRAVIRSTQYSGVDVLPANMGLVTANMRLLMDTTRPQQTRLQKALAAVSGDYDYCIIDNAPDINMSTINALVASDYVIIPIKLDQFAFDGLDILMEKISEIQEFNSGLVFAGCFVTMFYKDSRGKYEGSTQEADNLLRSRPEYKVFDYCIRRTPKVDESTYSGQPIAVYSKWCNASRDYAGFVRELLERCPPAQ